MREICTVWRASLDQDGPEPDEVSISRDRYFRVGKQRYGLVPIRGELLPEVAALLGNLLSGVNAPRSDANKAALAPGVAASTGVLDTGLPNTGERSTEERSAGGVRFRGISDDAEDTDAAVSGAPDATTPRDERSYGQKMHDALMVLAQLAAKSADAPTVGGSPVTVLIQAIQADLVSENTSGRPAGSAWLHCHDGVPAPISMAALRHAVCAGATQRALVNRDGRILGIESLTRTFTPHQRRAIMVRDGRCIIPGCTVPATWCEVHHVTPWGQMAQLRPITGCCCAGTTTTTSTPVVGMCVWSVGYPKLKPRGGSTQNSSGAELGHRYEK